MAGVWQACLSSLWQQNVKLPSQAIEVFMASRRGRICIWRMPAILLEGCDQGSIAKILCLPEHNWEWKSGNQVEQLDDPLGCCEIGRIRSEVGRFFLKPLPGFIFERG